VIPNLNRSLEVSMELGLEIQIKDKIKMALDSFVVYQSKDKKCFHMEKNQTKN
jgi:hypothetical protein